MVYNELIKSNIESELACWGETYFNVLNGPLISDVLELLEDEIGWILVWKF